MLLPPPRSPLFPYTTLFRSVLPVLNELRDLPSGYASRDAAVPVAYRFGLFQGDGIGERSVGTYRRALGDVLLRSEEHTSELQSRVDLVCRLLLEKKK